MYAPEGGLVESHLSLPQHSTKPSFLTPHACECPTLTEANSSDGGAARSSISSPQHATDPSSLTAQDLVSPTLIDTNAPCGDLIRPIGVATGIPELRDLVTPQHSNLPSALTPHE